MKKSQIEKNLDKFSRHNFLSGSWTLDMESGSHVKVSDVTIELTPITDPLTQEPTPSERFALLSGTVRATTANGMYSADELEFLDILNGITVNELGEISKEYEQLTVATEEQDAVMRTKWNFSVIIRADLEVKDMMLVGKRISQFKITPIGLPSSTINLLTSRDTNNLELDLTTVDRLTMPSLKKCLILISDNLLGDVSSYTVNSKHLVSKYAGDLKYITGVKEDDHYYTLIFTASALMIKPSLVKTAYVSLSDEDSNSLTLMLDFGPNDKLRLEI